jgi:hypothetical protein
MNTHARIVLVSALLLPSSCGGAPFSTLLASTDLDRASPLEDDDAASPVLPVQADADADASPRAALDGARQPPVDSGALDAVADAPGTTRSSDAEAKDTSNGEASLDAPEPADAHPDAGPSSGDDASPTPAVCCLVEVAVGSKCPAAEPCTDGHCEMNGAGGACLFSISGATCIGTFGTCP